MTEVLFYHLERQTLEQALPKLLEASLKRDWKAVVQLGSHASIKALNDHLWTYRENSFLPHGRALDEKAEEFAVDQPIWLTVEDDNPNMAQVLFLVHGAMRDDIAGFQRCVYMFDGGDAQMVQQARIYWKALQDTEHETIYYQQNLDGKWEKKA